MAREITAAGAVLWRPAAPGGVEVALVHRPRHRDWSLPKGKLERDESVHAAAVREVAEETGFRAVLGRRLLRVRYPVDGVDKRVDYFAARAGGGGFRPNDEVDRLRWLSPGEAAREATHDSDREVLAAFAAAPADTATVLLVRHAHAGKRGEWPGPDAERPLSRAGRDQVRALTRLLPLFGPDRVSSVPKTRCVDTVAPLAARVGVPVLREPALAEEEHKRDPAASLARLRAIAAGGGAPVVCSQGGVIPDLVRALLEESGVEPSGAPAEIRSRKGSVWVLSFAPGEPRLVAAEYVPRS